MRYMLGRQMTTPVCLVERVVPWIIDCLCCVAQEIGQQLEAAALAMRMAMEADTMEDSASSGNGAQHSTNKAAEKESKQVYSVVCCAEPYTPAFKSQQMERSCSGGLMVPVPCTCPAVQSGHFYPPHCAGCLEDPLGLTDLDHAELPAEHPARAARPKGAVERRSAGVWRRRGRHQCGLQCARPVLAVGRLRPGPGMAPAVSSQYVSCVTHVLTHVDPSGYVS